MVRPDTREPSIPRHPAIRIRTTVPCSPVAITAVRANRDRERKHETTEVQSTEPAAHLNHPAPRRSSRSPAPVAAQFGVQVAGPATIPRKVHRASVPDSIAAPIPQSETRRAPESTASGMPARRFAERPGVRA